MKLILYYKIILVALFVSTSLYFYSLFILSGYYEQYLKISTSSCVSNYESIISSYKRKRVSLSKYTALVVVCLLLVGGRFYLYLNRNKDLNIQSDKMIGCVMFVQVLFILILVIYYGFVLAKYLKMVHGSD